MSHEPVRGEPFERFNVEILAFGFIDAKLWCNRCSRHQASRQLAFFKHMRGFAPACVLSLKTERETIVLQRPRGRRFMLSIGGLLAGLWPQRCGFSGRGVEAIREGPGWSEACTSFNPHRIA